jgi:hypothetical protein
MIPPDAAHAYLILRRIASGRRLTSSNDFTTMSRQVMIDMARAACAEVELSFAEKEAWYGARPPARGDGLTTAPIRKMRLCPSRTERIDKKRRAMRLREEPIAPHIPKQDRKRADHDTFRQMGG